MPNLLPRDDLQETNEETPITQVWEQIIHMQTGLEREREGEEKEQAVNDSMLPFVCYTIFIPALTQP